MTSKFCLCLLVLTLFVPVSFAQEEAVAQVVGVPANSQAVGGPAKSGPITVTVDLVGGQKISGALTDMSMLPVRTWLGEASVPLAEVAGIKLASTEDPSTTIIMKNGDSITVAADLKMLSVDTDWGSAKINGSSITSILFLPDLKWNASIGLNGKRWSLVDSKSTPSASPSNPPTGLPGTRPATNVPGSSGTIVPNNNGARIVTPG